VSLLSFSLVYRIGSSQYQTMGQRGKHWIRTNFDLPLDSRSSSFLQENISFCLQKVTTITLTTSSSTKASIGWSEDISLGKFAGTCLSNHILLALYSVVHISSRHAFCRSLMRWLHVSDRRISGPLYTSLLVLLATCPDCILSVLDVQIASSN
jgi:hypothetical protein